MSKTRGLNEIQPSWQIQMRLHKYIKN